MYLRFLKYAVTASLAASGIAAAQQTTQNPPTTDQAQTSPQTTPGSSTQSATEPSTATTQTPVEAPVAGGPSSTTKKSATEEIVVTGTRVRRKDLNTPAPVTVVSRDQITASGRVSLGEFLQALPEQGNSGANAQVNNGNDGSIRVALRSLGSQRTLILVNGRRMVAGGTGADSSADLNTIPAAAIERIEVLKDGASAIYGSDAIAGVVNVILRKRFNGTEVGGYAGTSSHGDATTYDVHALTGTAGDKGSALFSIGYQEQRPAFAKDREWAKTTYGWDFGLNSFVDAVTGNPVPKAQAGTGNSTTFPNGRFAIPSAACDNAALVASRPALASVCNQLNGPVGNDPNFTGSFMSDPAHPGTEIYVPWAGDLYNTNPTNYMITPSRRVQLFGTGDVNLGSEARAFFEASYVNRTSSQSLAPMPLVNSTIPSAPVTISANSIYNPFGVNITSWRRRTVEFGERFWRQDLDTFRVVAGLDGSLGEWAGPLSGWSWSADYNHGRTAGNQLETGQLRMPNIANAVGPSIRVDALNNPTTDPNGRPVCLRAAPDPSKAFDKSTIIAGCVPLDVLHGVGTLSPAAKQYVSYDGTDFGHNQQDIFEANVSGELIKLGSERPVGLALGADYRRETGSFINNPINGGLESSGNNALSTNGGYNVKEAYGELVLPLIGGMPLVEDLELQVAGRYNDFSTFGNYSTYKLGARYSPIRDLTARATYGTAYRAPNIGELFGGTADDYPLARDPCRIRSTTPDIVKQRCLTGPGAVPGGNSGDRSTQLLSKHFANPNLGPETATTFTAGVVLQPQMVRNLSLTVDYYNLNVTKIISTRGANFILDQCYRADNQNPTMCALIQRGADGKILQINDERANLGSYHTTGIDFAARYALGYEDLGRVSLIFDGTWLNSYRATNEVGVVTQGAGLYDLGVLPKLKFNTGVFWTIGPLGAGVSARYIGRYTECFNGGNGGCLQDPVNRKQIASYMPFDVFASYTLKGWAAGTTALVLGVQNVGNIDPPYISDTNAFAVNSDPSAYDYVGRFFYTRLTHTF